MEYTTNEVNIASYSAQPQQLYHQEIFDFFFLINEGFSTQHFIISSFVEEFMESEV